MNIRPMMPFDVDTIHAIHCLCLERTLMARYTSEQIDAWMAGRVPQGYLRAAERGERFFVAEHNGTVVGFASWQDEELLSLFVHPDFHGRRIGSALLCACFEDAVRRSASISVVKSVLGAEEFYSRHGFLTASPGSASKRGVLIPLTKMQRVTC